MKTHKIQHMLLALCMSMVGIAQASALDESEINNPIIKAQQVDIPDGAISISAVLGKVTGPVVDDLDFYIFWGKEGDLVTVDIDGAFGGLRSFDSMIAIFRDAPGYPLMRTNDDASPLDPGSISTLDSRIELFRLPATGNYIVGVSNYPRYFMSGGSVGNPTRFTNGDYKLIISGVSSPVMQINIDIKPGNADEAAPMNLKSRGKIPVALLSSKEFDAMKVNKTSLTFGRTGKERSLVRCGSAGEDVNGDNLLDLVCHFDNQTAGFDANSLEGLVRGKTMDGRQFEGRGVVKIVPGPK